MTTSSEEGVGTGDEAEPSVSGRRRVWVLAAASVASFVVALDLLVITTALDTIRQDLGASPSALQWTVTAYSVSFAALLMTGAALGDRFGRRRMMVVGLVIFASGSGAAALANGVGMLIVARVVQGAGGAIILPLGLTIVTSVFPRDRRAAAIGTLEGVAGLAVIAGPLAGGGIAHHLTWEWVFWINVPLALAAVPVIWLVVGESYGPDATLDGPGLLLVTAAGFGVIWGLVRGDEAGWASPEVLISLAGGVVLGAAFVAWERRALQPIVPLAFFRLRSFSVGAGASFFFVGSLYASVFFIAQFIQVGLGEDSMDAGLRLLPWTSCLLVVAPVAGGLADRIGLRPVLSTGLLLQALGMGWLAFITGPELTYLQMVPPLVLAGIGASVAVPVSQAAIVGAVADADVGKAAGCNNMLQELGGAFGIAVAVATFSAAGGYATSEAFTDGFGAAMGASALLAALAGATALGLPRRA